MPAVRSQARQFQEAALRCIPQPMQDGIHEGPIAPGVVCAALSVELWLKAMICAADPTGNVPGGHNLFTLFKKLPEKVQTALLDRCGRSRDEFEKSLEADANAFIVWRYTYEHGAGASEPIEALSTHVGLLFALGKACEDVDGRFFRD